MVSGLVDRVGQGRQACEIFVLFLHLSRISHEHKVCKVLRTVIVSSHNLQRHSMGQIVVHAYVL